MMLVGILIFASIFEMSDKSSTFSMADGAGYGIRSVGGVPSVWKSKEIVYLPTGSVTKERSLFRFEIFGQTYEMIENEQLNGETEIKSSGSGNVRLDVMISQDNKFAAVQLYQFVPLHAYPVTSVCYYTGSDAVAVSTSCPNVKRCNQSKS